MLRSALALAALLLIPALPVEVPLVGVDAAWAKADKWAELMRLQEDMERLARRNAWKGVARKYGEALELEIEVQPWVHMLAYEAGRNLGDMTLARDACARASTSETTDEAQQQAAAQGAEQLAALDAAYGPVHLQVAPKRIPALVRPDMPFDPGQRRAIEFAQEQLAQGRRFQGILPLGRYMVDGVFFEVVANTEPLVVDIK